MKLMKSLDAKEKRMSVCVTTVVGGGGYNALATYCDKESLIKQSLMIVNATGL